ncbi:hypothetical protein [Cellulosimicrobium arenosum]|uniref:Uncharacterized protein n=1 Tax=Cellulosimicrobium arenosum TaxID=2708133 RepID=A0A927J1R2_9MICO|nr:hypothetical protein [Cellulosimicrobium arenosum]MBD8080321.1 hypothetical protein [Cellulosimicrobium arenosum]
MATIGRAREAKALLRDELAGSDGVTGVGLSRARRGASEGADVDADDWVLRVNVETSEVHVPGSVAGVDVEVRVVGAISPT